MATDLTAILSLARQHYVDLDTNSPAVTDAQLTKLLNEAYYKWLDVVDPRYQRMATATSGLGIDNTPTVQTTKTCTPTNIVEIASAEVVAAVSAAATDIGAPMEKIEFKEWLALYADSATAESTTPKKYAVVRPQTDTEADQGKLAFYWYPLSSNDFSIILTARLLPAALSSGTDEPDVNEEARYVLARIVAAHAAHQCGEGQEFIATILAPIPEKIQQSMGVAELWKKPRIKPGERPI